MSLKRVGRPMKNNNNVEVNSLIVEFLSKKENNELRCLKASSKPSFERQLVCHIENSNSKEIESRIVSRNGSI